MSEIFSFKQFSVRNEQAALKVGTDAVLLGAAMSIAPGTRRALDIGTGTGVIALMVAQRCADLEIDAVDIDAPSVQEAAENFAASAWSTRLRALHCDLRRFVPEKWPDSVGTAHPFDARSACIAVSDNTEMAHAPAADEHAAQPPYGLIFSNPPFFDDSLLNPDEREAAARHSKTLTLSDICAFASTNLIPSGSLALILPQDRAQALIRIAASFGLYPYNLINIQTTAKKPVKRCILEFCKQRRTTAISTLVLMNEGRRSKEYQELTREFYL